MIRLGPLIVAACLISGFAFADELDEFRSRADEWLLTGQGLPRDYRVTLMQMDSPTRFQAIAYLRRVGLLTERPWSLDDLLRPAAARTEPSE